MPQNRAGDTFGSRLRAARERRGLSLRHIAGATKISMVVLEALEHDDYSRLPGGIFSRAFVRAYALQVGLDPDATIDEFAAQLPQAAAAAVHRAGDTIEDHVAVESERQAATAAARLIAISVPVAVVLIVFGVRGLRAPAPEAPPADAPAPIATPAMPIAAAEHAPAPAPVDVPVEVPVAASGVVPAPAVEPAAAAPPAAEERASATDGERLTMALSAARECWLSLAIDGRKLPGVLMAAGDRRTVEAAQEIELNVGDGDALSVTINGWAVRPLGAPGQVVHLRVTPANFRQYLVQP